MRIPQADLDEIIAIDPGFWEKLRGARLFLTGVSGFFGCWILESLLRADEHLSLNLEVIALIRNPELFKRKAPHLAGWKALHLIQGDVREFDFPEGEFSHVAHLAASSDAAIQAADPVGLFDVIVNGTKRVLEFACQRNTQRFLFVSSGAVYGTQPAHLDKIPEDYQGAPDPLLVQSVYGTSKRAAEQLCGLYNGAGRLQIMIARPFAFIGPGMPLDWHFAACNFIRDAMTGGPIKIKGDGTTLRTYLYAADLAWWLWKILLDGKPGRPYNIGGGKVVSIRELAENVSQCFSPRLNVITARQPEDGKKAEQYVPDISRAQEELGLCVRISIKEALQRTIAWHYRQGELQDE